MCSTTFSSLRLAGGAAFIAGGTTALLLIACSSPPPAQTGSASRTAEPTSVPAPVATPTLTATASASTEPVASMPVCPVDPPPEAPPRTGKKAVSVSMGTSRACAALEDGRVSCWGGEGRGYQPHVIDGVDDAAQVAVVGNTDDVLVARKDGSVLRIGRDWKVTKVTGLKDVVELRAGTNLAAVRAKDGTAQVAEVMPGAPKLIFQKLPVKDAKQVTAAGHTCVLDAQEQVHCFLVSGIKIKPYSIVALPPVKRLLSGGAATCATLADGTNRCFEVGQGSSHKPVDLPAGTILGLSNVEADHGPTACFDTPAGLACRWLDLGSDSSLPYLREAPLVGKALTAGVEWASNGSTACLRDAAGKLSCWGWAGGGLLGEPDPSSVAWPSKVPGVEGAVSLANGSLFSCASLDDGRVMCWGNRPDEKDPAIDPKVRIVPGLSDVAKLTRVDSNETCATKKDGSVVCFGGGTGTWTLKQEPAPGLHGFRQIEYLNGKNGIALLDAQGALLAATSFGILDVRITNVKLAQVPGLPPATRLFYEEDTVLVVTESGQAWTMSADSDAKLGKPRREPRLDHARAVVSYWAVLWDDGTVSFGDPRRGASPREKAPGIVDLLDARGPGTGLCGVTSDGVVLCRADDKQWSRLPGLPKIVAHEGYWGQACVIDTCGGVHCWGKNWAGQAGVSGMPARPAPKPLDL
ncbi:MAG: RCC1 domain-containing protein [Polyangiaceae bacterium]